MFATLSHGTVLVADERPMARETAARRLRRAGYRVREVGSARQTLELLAGSAIDLLLLSTSLPDLPGLGLLQHLHSRLGHATPPVVVLDEPEHPWTAEAFALGASDAWTRDITAAELHARVERRLGDVRLDRRAGLLAAPALRTELSQAVERAQARGRTTSVLAIELGGMRALTESQGFEAAERAVVNFSHRLLAALPVGTTVARVGGETLVALLPDLQRESDLQGAVTAVMRAGLAPVSTAAEPLRFVPVVGQATYPCDGTNADALMQAADRSLASARRASVNQVLRHLPVPLGA